MPTTEHAGPGLPVFPTHLTARPVPAPAFGGEAGRKAAAMVKPHAVYGDLSGRPTDLDWLLIQLFRAMVTPDERRSAVRCVEATPLGADLSSVMDRFRLWLLHNLLALTLDPVVEALILETIGLMERTVMGQPPNQNEWWIQTLPSSLDKTSQQAAESALEIKLGKMKDLGTSEVIYARYAWASCNESEAWTRRASETLVRLLQSCPVAI